MCPDIRHPICAVLQQPANCVLLHVRLRVCVLRVCVLLVCVLLVVEKAHRALQILSGIPQEFVSNVLKMQAAPHDLCILQSILVPPTCIRPATVTRSTKADQDLTRSLVDIVKANAAVLHVQQQQQQQHQLQQQQQQEQARIWERQRRHQEEEEEEEEEPEQEEKQKQQKQQHDVAPALDQVEDGRADDGARISRTDAEIAGVTVQPAKGSVGKGGKGGKGGKSAKSCKQKRMPVPKPKLPTGDVAKLLAENVSKLQQAVSAYVDRDVSTRKRRTAGPQRQRQSLVDRFGGGKKGRMRSNMMGRRVNNCARFVVGPDALIDLWELRIPRSVAIETTREEVVGAHNFDEMCRCIRIGTSGIGGAQYVIMNDGTRSNLKNLTPAATERVLQRLAYGCTVHRMLRQSDIGVFNRQPSLSKYSVGGHELLPDAQGGKNSGRFPPNTCGPYNADFDGTYLHFATASRRPLLLPFILAI